MDPTTIPMATALPVDPYSDPFNYAAAPLPEALSLDTNPDLILQHPLGYLENLSNHPIVVPLGNGPYVALNLNVIQDLVALSSKAGQIASVLGHLSTTLGGYIPARDGSSFPFGTAAPDSFRSSGHTPQPANGAPRTLRKRAKAACISCHDSRKTCGASRPCDRCRERDIECEDRPRKKARTTLRGSQDRTGLEHAFRASSGTSG